MIAADRAATYRAIVVNNQDPEGRNRCQLQIPQLMGGARSGWAMPIPAVGAEVPAVGDQVMITFEGADLSRPAYFAPTSSKAAQQAQTAANGAQTTANNALGAAQEAQSTADTARGEADQAKSSAATAQSTADAAKTDAATGPVTTDRLRPAAAARDSAAVSQLAGDIAPALPPKSISTGQLADVSVTGPKLADAAVTTNKVADKSVTGTKLADDALNGKTINGVTPLDAQLGSLSITLPTNVAYTTAAVRFPRTFAYTPAVFVNPDTAAGGTGDISLRAYGCSTTGFSIYVRSTTTNNFSQAVPVSIRWAAFAAPLT